MINFEGAIPSDRLVDTLNQIAPCVAKAAAEYVGRPVSDFVVVQFDPDAPHADEPGKFINRALLDEGGTLSSSIVHPLIIVDTAQLSQSKFPNIFDGMKPPEALFDSGLQALVEATIVYDVTFPKSKEAYDAIRVNALAAFMAIRQGSSA